MKPVWIRYYGVIPMTKRGYLIALAAAGLFAVLVVAGAALLGVLPPLSTLWQPDPNFAGLGFGGWVYNHMYWLFLVCLVAQVLDTTITLRTFAKKEAEQSAWLEDPHRE